MEASRKFTAFHGSPLPTQLGQHLGQAFSPFFRVTQPSLLDLPSQGSTASGKLLSLSTSCFYILKLMPTLAGRAMQSLYAPQMSPHPSDTTSLNGAFLPLALTQPDASLAALAALRTACLLRFLLSSLHAHCFPVGFRHFEDSHSSSHHLRALTGLFLNDSLGTVKI